MENAELFRQAFNEIEDSLKKIAETTRHINFSELVNRAALLNRTVKLYKEDLHQYGNLRNAIVHSSSDKFMADPLVETLENIQRILDLIKNPPKIGRYAKQNLLKCNTNDNITKVLILMKEKNFSQVPVFDDKSLIGLLTTDTISRWVANELDKNGIMDNEATVEYVLRHTEYPANFKILSRNDVLIDALSAFEVSSSTNFGISAILITENGKKTESLLGIITQFDLPEINSIIYPTVR